MKRMRAWHAAWILVLNACMCAHGADDLAPLAPFYPARKTPGRYDPARFLPPAEAQTALARQTLREQDFSAAISLDGDWRISRLENASEPFPQSADLDKGFDKRDFVDSSWDVIAVPLNWYSKYPNAMRKEAPYVKGWYRKTIIVPAAMMGRRMILHFDVVGYDALLFVNGQQAGRHHGDFTPWDADVTADVEPGKPAVVALRVFSDLGPIFGAKPDATHAYGAQWSRRSIKGGIWQHCEIRFEPQIRVAEALVSPDFTNASVHVDCLIRNDSPAGCRTELYAAISPAEAALASAPAHAAKIAVLDLAPGETRFAFSVPLEHPRTWTPGSPALYHLSLPLLTNGQAIAQKTVRFGFRDFRAHEGRFFLNGAPIYLFGENVPAVKYGGDGSDRATLKARAAAELLNFKSLGYNMVRNAHMPIVPEFLEAADEVGMLLYDEWCWCFTSTPGPDFERNNLEEVGEWVRRDYNHPCVAMWSGGNEIKSTASLVGALDRQTTLIHSLDRSGRPVGVFGGSACPEFGGSLAFDTDVLDLHTYVGLGPRPWTYWERDFNSKYANTLRAYAAGDRKTLDMPYVAWELVGFSWGEKSEAYAPGDAKTYLKWAQGRHDWANPNGIGWAGAIGLDAALDSKRGSQYGMATIGRRVIEFIRQDARIAGFAPWFQCSDLAPATLWTQPIYCGLRGDGGLPLRNVFGGRSYHQRLFAANVSPADCTDIVVRVTLAEADGSEQVLAEWRPDRIAAWQQAASEVNLRFPAAGRARWAQIRVRMLMPDGAEVSRNFYDVFVQEWEAAMAPVEMPGHATGVLSCNATGTEHLEEILHTLKIRFVEVTTPELLRTCRALIVPPSVRAPAIGAPMAQAIANWVKSGGTLLTLEQSWNGAFPLVSKTLKATPVILADLVRPSHPAFKGLSQANFEFWSNPAFFGQTGAYVFSPIDADLVAAKGPMGDSKETGAILTDARFGQGRMIVSQFDACALWDVDSAASVYLRNLLCSALSPVSPKDAVAK